MRATEKTKDQLLEDMATFAQLQLDSGDMDPAYPVLVELQRDMTTEQALWHTILYVAYYNLTSGALAYAAAPNVTLATTLGNLKTLPCATERRGHRTPAKMDEHLRSWKEAARVFGSLEAFLTVPEVGELGWNAVTERLTMIHGNGRWAAYKTAEILMTNLGWKIEAPGIGADGATGPAQGLELIFAPTRNASVMETEAVLIQRLLSAKYNLLLPLNILETVLCDFHSLYEGRYYVGHDIDQMQSQIAAGMSDAHKHGISPRPVWEVFNARGRALPHAYLGEYNDWEGVVPGRDRRYADTGDIIYRLDVRKRA